MEVLRSCPGSPHPLVVLRSWRILIIAVKQHQLLGFWMIMAQSNTDARGKIACCPSDRPENMVQQLADVDRHHIRCRCAIDRDAIATGTSGHLTSTVRPLAGSQRSSDTSGQDYKRFSSMSRCSTHNLCSEMT